MSTAQSHTEQQDDGMTVLCRDCLAIRTDASNEAAQRASACPHCASERQIAHPELLTLDTAHIDCDAFYASVEKRDDPSLADKPLIIGGTSGRGVVTTACYIARKFGPRSAMPMFKAMQLCPQAVVLKPDMAKYKAVSQQIRAIFRAATPVIEPLSLDEAYLDLSDDVRFGDRLVTSPEQATVPPEMPPAALLADIARRIESEVGITVSIGLSYNKFLAKLASDLDKPRGFSVIGRSEARRFLAGLPVGRLHGVGRATEEKMIRRGITTVAQLQALPDEQLVAWFGRFGRRLSELVQGIDERRINPSQGAKSVSAETTFRQDIHEAGALVDALIPLAERVGDRLVKSGLAGQTVVLKLKTADFQILTRNRKLAHPTQRAQVMTDAVSELLMRECDGRAFRLIGIGVADVGDAREADPPDLFSL